LKKNVIYFLSSLFGTIPQLLIFSLYSKIFTIEDYGIYALSLSISSVLVGVFTFGLNIGFERNINLQGTSSGKIQYLFTVCAVLVLFYIVLIFLYVLFSKYIFYDIIYRFKLTDFLLISIYLAIFQSLKQLFYTFLRYEDLYLLYFKSILIDGFLCISLSYVLVVLCDFGLLGVFIGFLVGSIVVFSLLCALLFYKNHVPIFALSKAKETIQLTRILSLRAILNTFSSNMDKFIIVGMSKYGDLGLYFMGQRVGNLTFMLLTAFQNVYGPKLYKLMFDLNSDLGNKISEYLRIPFMFSLIVSFLSGVFSEEIFYIMGLGKYVSLELIFISATFSFTNSFTFFGKIPALMYDSRVVAILKYSILSTIIISLLQFVFLKFYNLTGMMLGTILASIINVCYLIFINQRSFKLNLNHRYISYSYALLLFIFMSILVLYWLDYSYIIRLLLKVALTIIFVIFLGLVGFLRVNDFKRIFKND
jgi:O-antigen/teichoic acid export membrane protein